MKYIKSRTNPMPRIYECPKCGVDISGSYQPAEPDVGIGAGWYCDACNEGFGDEDGPEPNDDDVMVSGTGSSSHICACGTLYEMGYGLAGGGGIGPYMYCPICGTISGKSIDPEPR
jgi:hypothetical protein